VYFRKKLRKCIRSHP